MKTKNYITTFRLSLVRDKRIKTENRPVLGEPETAAKLCRAMVGPTDREHFLLIMLDAGNRVIGTNLVSIGTLTASLVHPREVFKPAIPANAASIIIAHNHPSGDAAPSSEDRETTRRLVQAGKVLGIPVVDHVVFTDTRFFSFREQGLL